MVKEKNKMDDALWKLVEKLELFSRIYQVPSIWPEKQNKSKKPYLKSEKFYLGYITMSLFSLLFTAYTFKFVLHSVLSSDKTVTLKARFLCTVIGVVGIVASRYDYEALILHKELRFVITELKKLVELTTGK